jgi:hypothetical protein
VAATGPASRGDKLDAAFRAEWQEFVVGRAMSGV